MVSVAKQSKADIKQMSTASALIAITSISAVQQKPATVGRHQKRASLDGTEPIGVEYIFVLATRKIPATTEKQLVYS